MTEAKYIELNMDNYDEDDVGQLNDWGIEAAQLIESTENMLRWMTVDPAIPDHAKEAMRDQIKELEAAIAE